MPRTAPLNAGSSRPRRGAAGCCSCWPARRVVVAGHVALQPAEQLCEVRNVVVGYAASQPLIERDGHAAQPVEGGLAVFGQPDQVDAAVCRVTPTGDKPLGIHGVQVVGERGLPDPHGVGEFPLVAWLPALERDEHEPDGKRSPGFGQGVVEGSAHRPGSAGQLEADRRTCGPWHVLRVPVVSKVFDIE